MKYIREIPCVIVILSLGFFSNGQADTDTSHDSASQALVLAALSGDGTTVQKLINEGVNPNVENSNRPVLAWAAQKGHLAVVQSLLKGQADLNAQDENGRTALMLAAIEGHKEIVAILLRAKADRNLKDKAGQTALLLANAGNKSEVISLLTTPGL